MQSKSVCLNYCCWSRIELGLLLLLEFNGVLHKLFIKVKKKEIRLSYPSVCTLVPEEAEDFFFYQNMSKRLSPATPLYAQTVQRAAAKIKKKRRSHDIHANLPCPCVLFHSEGFCEKEEIFVKKM